VPHTIADCNTGSGSPLKLTTTFPHCDENNYITDVHIYARTYFWACRHVRTVEWTYVAKCFCVCPMCILQSGHRQRLTTYITYMGVPLPTSVLFRLQYGVAVAQPESYKGIYNHKYRISCVFVWWTDTTHTYIYIPSKATEINVVFSLLITEGIGKETWFIYDVRHYK
jgi:hypothetical protein